MSGFLETVASETDVSKRKRTLGRKLANAEIPVVLRVWPSTDASGESYLAESELRAFFEDHRFPAP